MGISGVIIPKDFISAIDRRVGGEVIVAGLAAVTTGTVDTNIKTRIGPGLGMAGLAVCHAVGEGRCQSFGGRSMMKRIEERSIQRMGYRVTKTKLAQGHG